MGYTEKEKVSVVVAVYNVEQFIEKCIQSICRQTYENLEIILVDDGSIDGSGEICDKWCEKDKRVRCIHKMNEGVSITRNTGINYAVGKFIVFVDGDDWLESTAIQILVDNYREGLLITAGYYLDIQTEKKNKAVEYRSSKDLIFPDEVISYFAQGLFSPVWNKLYNLDIIQNNGIFFEKGMNLGEDIVFNLKYLSRTCGQICNVEQPIYHYIKRNISSLDNKFCDDFSISQKKIYRTFFNYFGEERRNTREWNLLQQLFFNALIVSIDNVYLHKQELTADKYRALMKQRIYDEDIKAILEEMQGSKKIISQIRYYFITNHLYVVDFYLREIVKRILLRK